MIPLGLQGYVRVPDSVCTVVEIFATYNFEFVRMYVGEL
jgi:hypothetical protein